MAKKIVYTVEREFLKKYEVKRAVELMIAQYIKNGGEGKISDRTVADPAAD